MGHLDETAFAELLGPCPACQGGKYELHSIIDQSVPAMLGEAAGAARWIHDGEKFVDGTYRIVCLGCGAVRFESGDCPRCHAANALAAALRADSRVAVPSRCPGCGENQLFVTALVPAIAVHTGGPSRPRAVCELGDPGFFVVAVACEACGVVASSGSSCPVCNAPGPLRERP